MAVLYRVWMLLEFVHLISYFPSISAHDYILEMKRTHASYVPSKHKRTINETEEGAVAGERVDGNISNNSKQKSKCTKKKQKKNSNRRAVKQWKESIAKIKCLRFFTGISQQCVAIATVAETCNLHWSVIHPIKHQFSEWFYVFCVASYRTPPHPTPPPICLARTLAICVFCERKERSGNTTFHFAMMQFTHTQAWPPAMHH